jgi:hypothetical protein
LSQLFLGSSKVANAQAERSQLRQLLASRLVAGFFEGALQTSVRKWQRAFAHRREPGFAQHSFESRIPGRFAMKQMLGNPPGVRTLSRPGYQRGGCGVQACLLD